MPDALAIYGAAIGSAAAVGAVWNIYNTGFRDRARLKLIIKRGRFISQTEARVDVDGPILFIRATNIGHRPLTIVSGGLELSNKRGREGMREINSLPRELAENQEVTLWFDENDLKKLTKLPTYFSFLDTADKYHRRKIPRYLLNWIRQVVEAEVK